MAGIKISALTAAGSALLTDYFPVVQGGVTLRETNLQVATLFGFDSTTHLLGLASGGTNAALTAANGAVPYSTATAFGLVAPGTAGQLFQSGGAATPVWTTATYPATASTSGKVIVSDGTNFSSSFTTGITALGTQAQALNMGSHLINNVTNPVSAQDAATKAYVDAFSQGLTFQDACRVATTTALTVTYANGASGVGATLTNAGAFAALSIDGVTLAIGDRVLVKNQASTLQNGIYTATVLGDGVSVNWVMTRATDYDEAAEIQPGDLVLITSGTANANSSWVQTATVTAIGTDPITFSQFSASLPISVSNGGTGRTTSTTAYGLIAAGTTATGALQTLPTGTSGQILQSGGAAALPAYSTATYPSTAGTSGTLLQSDGTNITNTTSTYPATNAINTLLYASSANGMAALATVNNGTLTTSASGVPTWLTQVAITKINTQTITTTGAFTYTKTAGTQYAIFELQAAGGGAGGAGGASSQGAVGAGGGGGGYQKILVTGTSNLASITGSVGAGGTAGASGNNAGGAGGNTTLVINGGSTWTSTGGGGGNGQAANAAFQQNGEGAGGGNTSGTNGTLILAINGGNSLIGCIGAAAAASPSFASAGGASYLSCLPSNVATGCAGSLYGRGASGPSNQTGGNLAGFAGGNGVVIVTEFISV